MGSETPGSMTSLLNAAVDGDEAAAARVWTLLYEEVAGIAHRILAGESPQVTLETTVLVHEVYMRLGVDQRAHWDNRRHFFGAVSRAVGQYIIQQARRRSAAKRGGDRKRVPWSLVEGELRDFDMASSDMAERLIEAIRRLEQLAPRPAEVLWLRYVSGLSIEQVAEVLDISRRSVQKDWSFARAWLRRELGDDVKPKAISGAATP